MKKWAYYNDSDPYVCEWARNLIKAGLVPDGEVDNRSIADVRADDLREFTQCHFFCGILGWPYALRLAGWPDDRPIWSASCPCQPFSVAGRGAGTTDDRHLWPDFRRLIAECRPPVVVGEQVASADGRLWLAGVRADLEQLGYACGAADLPAAGVGAPHIRQRLYWVADAEGRGLGADRRPPGEPGHPDSCGAAGGLADAGCECDERGQRPGEDPRAEGAGTGEAPERQRVRADVGSTGGMDDSDRAGCSQHCGSLAVGAAHMATERPGGFGWGWHNAVLIACGDGKARRIEPGIFPLAHGVPTRVGRLRAYGNAIVPPLAAEFIGAVMEAAS